MGLENLRKLEKLPLVGVLPQQFSHRHLGLVDFPDRQPEGQEPHQEDNKGFAVKGTDVKMI